MSVFLSDLNIIFFKMGPKVILCWKNSSWFLRLGSDSQGCSIVLILHLIPVLKLNNSQVKSVGGRNHSCLELFLFQCVIFSHHLMWRPSGFNTWAHSVLPLLLIGHMQLTSWLGRSNWKSHPVICFLTIKSLWFPFHCIVLSVLRVLSCCDMTKSSVKRKCFTLNTSDSFSLVVCSYFISVFPGEKWRSKPPNTIKKKRWNGIHKKRIYGWQLESSEGHSSWSPV